MRFTVEIFAHSEGTETVLHRTMITAMNPVFARKEARHLLATWKKRKADSARLLNAHGETLYSWNE